MEERIITLSKSMGLYQDRGILTQCSIETVKLIPPDKFHYLIIQDYYPSRADIRKKEFDLNSRVEEESVIRGFAGVKENPLARARREANQVVVETLLMYEHKKRFASCEQVALDLILAINNAGMVQTTSKLRCWLPYVEHPADSACLFLDAGESVITDRTATAFSLERHINGGPIEIHDANRRACANSFPSNRDILEAYAHNLQEGIKS